MTSSDNALRALHRALTRTRYIAYTNSDAKHVARILDDVEYLATIIMRRNEYTEEEYVTDFRLHLEDIESKFSGFEGLVQAYNERARSNRKGGGVAKRMTSQLSKVRH